MTKYCFKTVKSGDIFNREGCHEFDSLQKLVSHVALELYMADPDDAFIADGWAENLKRYEQPIATICEKRFNKVLIEAVYAWIEE